MGLSLDATLLGGSDKGLDGFMVYVDLYVSLSFNEITTTDDGQGCILSVVKTKSAPKLNSAACVNCIN